MSELVHQALAFLYDRQAPRTVEYDEHDDAASTG